MDGFDMPFVMLYEFFTDFSVQIILSELIVLCTFPRRRLFWLRLVPCCLLFFIIPHLTDDFYNLDIFYAGWYNTSWMLMFLLSAAILWFCFDTDLRTILFYSTVGYALQHLVVSIRYVVNLGFEEAMTFFSIGIRFGITAVSYVLLYFIFIRPMLRARSEISRPSLLAFSLISIFTVNILSFFIFTLGN